MATAGQLKNRLAAIKSKHRVAMAKVGNPNHDVKGRFSSGDGGGFSVDPKTGPSKGQRDKASKEMFGVTPGNALNHVLDYMEGNRDPDKVGLKSSDKSWVVGVLKDEYKLNSKDAGELARHVISEYKTRTREESDTPIR